MVDKSGWDWSTPQKSIPIAEWHDRFGWVEEPSVSPDGERIAAIVNIDEGEFNVCVNGQTWDRTFDKIWYPRFSPDGRLTAIVSDMGEWTVAVDGQAWEARLGYVWQTQFSRNGAVVAVAAQQDMRYGMAVDDKLWPDLFSNLSNPRLSPDGRATAGPRSGPG